MKNLKSRGLQSKEYGIAICIWPVYEPSQKKTPAFYHIGEMSTYGDWKAIVHHEWYVFFLRRNFQ